MKNHFPEHPPGALSLVPEINARSGSIPGAFETLQGRKQRLNVRREAVAGDKMIAQPLAPLQQVVRQKQAANGPGFLWLQKAGILFREHFRDGAPTRGDHGQAVCHCFEQIHRLGFRDIVGRKNEEISFPEGGFFAGAADKSTVIYQFSEVG